jgi:phosphoglycerate dehydrogenase-like enzyme
VGPASRKGSLLSTEQDSPRPTIGVIGLGVIGGSIATNVRAAGLPLFFSSFSG